MNAALIVDAALCDDGDGGTRSRNRGTIMVHKEEGKSLNINALTSPPLAFEIGIQQQ